MRKNYTLKADDINKLITNLYFLNKFIKLPENKSHKYITRNQGYTIKDKMLQNIIVNHKALNVDVICHDILSQKNNDNLLLLEFVNNNVCDKNKFKHVYFHHPVNKLSCESLGLNYKECSKRNVYPEYKPDPFDTEYEIIGYNKWVQDLESNIMWLKDLFYRTRRSHYINESSAMGVLTIYNRGKFESIKNIRGGIVEIQLLDNTVHHLNIVSIIRGVNRGIRDINELLRRYEKYMNM